MTTTGSDVPMDALTIGYSSLAERAGSIVPPDLSTGFELLVLVQGDLARVAVPDAAVVHHVAGVGVARSRNAALDHAGRRYLLFCDDDVRVDLDGVAQGIAHLRRSGTALALGQATDPEGVPRKRYPRSVEHLTRRNSGRAATYEMLVDVDAVRVSGVRFDERFGAGAPLYLGDEYLFIVDLLRAGLTADAVPFLFGIHPTESSGSRWGGRDSHVRAVVLNRAFGRLAPGVRLAFGVRHRADLGGWRAVARFVADGARPDSAG